MTRIGIFQVIFYLFTLFVLAKPLGLYMARVYQGQSCGLNFLLGSFEKLIYRCARIDSQQQMNWKSYLSAMLWFNLLGLVSLYLIQRSQYFLPLNPQKFSTVAPDLAFNTAVSFVTNTDWQAYSGENSLSYLTQMLGLTVQNFLSAGSGMALLVALIRGISRHETTDLGNFWADLVRGVLYICLPLSLLLALVLVSQGVIQNFKSYETVQLIQPFSYTNPANLSPSSTSLQTNTVTTQVLPMGPVASQIAIKQLGTNGGGFFNANSAHPFENPTPLSNFLEMLALLLIPAAFCYTFGAMVKDRNEGLAILMAMTILLLPLIGISVSTEQQGNPAFIAMGIDPVQQYDLYPAGNMEGKETRFGITSSALYAVATTASSNGAMNAALDSFMPLGNFASLWLMHLGEVAFGGVGSGLMGMLMLVIVTVFIAGLMVGRTPEYLGKKIEPFEMKMASIAVLVMPLVVLLFTAIAVVSPDAVASRGNPGAHGLTEILYALTSMVNNNGSAMAGLTANTPFYNLLGGLAMLIGRFGLAIPMLALAGSLVEKKQIPRSLGTLVTHTPLFIVLLVGVALVLGALSFVPALALGPIVEHLMIWGPHG